jgi:serine protease
MSVVFVAFSLSPAMAQSTDTFENIGTVQARAALPPAIGQVKPIAETAKKPTRLILLRSHQVDDPVVPKSAKEIVSEAGKQDASAKKLLEEFGNPKSVFPLIVEGRSSEYIANLEQDSAEYRLLNYVVLEFIDEATMAFAKKKLQNSKSYAAVEEEVHDEFSAVPNDPYFAPSGQTSPLNRQWGLSAMNFPSAWDIQRGYAYVGIADNGIQRNHQDLTEDRLGNVRAHLSGEWNTTSLIVAPSSGNFDEAQNSPGRGHGTHVAGIVGATTGNSTGVSGACQRCSLLIAKTSTLNGIPQPNSASAIYGLISRGAQVINMSFGNGSGQSCAGSPAALTAYCDAISYAASRDVVLVAAAGNQSTALQFPASDPRVFSVGGYQVDNQPWNQLIALPDSPMRNTSDGLGETGTNFGGNQLVVAPARDVLSSMYTNTQWNSRCGSVSTFNTSPPMVQFSPNSAVIQSIHASGSGNRYGICTGTSMAAPHVAGLVALIRSTNPLLTVAQVKSRIQTAAGGVFVSPTSGYGLPNASTAVSNSLPSQRLTPLFALWDYIQDDYVYTVFPQMGAALNDGSVPPFQLPSGSYTYYGTNKYLFYAALGNTVAQYPVSFPGVSTWAKLPIVPANFVPRARLRVFTTQRDANGTSLWPICRFSYVTTTAVRHITDAAPTCAQSLVPSFFTLDGIEGYVYPPNQSQPAGTVAVIRMEKPVPNSLLTWVFTSQSDQSYYTGLGFSNPVVVGYAYLN